MMQQKIEMVLTEMGVILGNYFPPSHKRLYALRRLGIRVPKVHHRDRKKELVVDDREKLSSLLTDLNQYVDHYGVEVFHKYYIQLWKQSLVGILNGDSD